MDSRISRKCSFEEDDDHEGHNDLDNDNDNLRIFHNVPGFGSKCNTLIYIPASSDRGGNVDQQHPMYETTTTTIPDVACFFGGDIQNLYDKMINIVDFEFSSPQIKRYAKHWSLEQCARKIYKYFHCTTDVVVVIAAKQYRNFSCYTNFVECIDQYGSPRYVVDSVDALQHLYHLLDSLYRLIGSCGLTTTTTTTTTTVAQQPKSIGLIGFSKGSVVLNQLVYCLAVSTTTTAINYQSSSLSPSPPSLSSKYRITHWYFLDNGHCGNTMNDREEKWITKSSLIDAMFKEANDSILHVYIGATDYQLVHKHDSKIVAQQEKTFYQSLQQRKRQQQQRINLERLYLSKRMLVQDQRQQKHRHQNRHDDNDNDDNVQKNDHDKLWLHFSIIDHVFDLDRC